MMLAPGKFGSAVILVQLCLIVIYAFIVEYDEDANVNMISSNSSGTVTKSNSIHEYYAMFQDVDVMIFVGFGFLMTFAKKYAHSAVGMNMFLAAISIQWAMIMQGVWKMKNGKINLGITSLINGNFASATVLISYGALLGKTSPLQTFVMAIIEITIFACNEHLGTGIYKAIDIGGSIFLHTFGAYFGLAVSYILYRKDWLSNSKEGSNYNSDVFAMIGTLFLWMFWPSFNSAMGIGNEKHRCVINTYASLLACCVVTFAISSLINKNNKFNMVHIQNATLAGGVAVGAIANVLLHPYGALVVGALAGTISTLGYKYVMPFLLKKLRLHDTCGVNNLHGMPGILSGLLSIIIASVARESEYGISLYKLYPARVPEVFNATDPGTIGQLLADENFVPGDGWTASNQAIGQLEALLSTMAIALTGGALTGYVLRHPFLDPPKTAQLFDDSDYWELPEDNEH